MQSIKHIFRLTIIDNGKTISKSFPNYKQAFFFCGDYLIKNNEGLSWSRNLKKIIKYTESRDTNKYKETIFLEDGFTKKKNKYLLIYIDELFEGTEKKYPVGKNILSKHRVEFIHPKKELSFNSLNYKKAYFKIGESTLANLGYNWSYSLKYMTYDYDKTPYFIYGKNKNRIKNISITIMPL